MYPTRIKNPKIGDKVIFYEKGFTLSYVKEGEYSELIRFNEYTIKNIITSGPGTPFVTFIETGGQHDLSSFIYPNDKLLRKLKLMKIYEKRI